MAKKLTVEEERSLVSNIGGWRNKRHSPQEGEGLLDQFMPDDILTESVSEPIPVVEPEKIICREKKERTAEIPIFVPKLDKYIKKYHETDVCELKARTTLRLPETVSLELLEIVSMLNCTRIAVPHDKYTLNQYVLNVISIHLKENKEAIYELKKSFSNRLNDDV